MGEFSASAGDSSDPFLRNDEGVRKSCRTPRYVSVSAEPDTEVMIHP